MNNYLFISNTDYGRNQLTGAHKRFLELVNYFSVNSKITLIATKNCEKMLMLNENITFIPFEYNCPNWFPKHVYSAFALLRKLIQIKNSISYEVAISFGPVSTMVYWAAGYRKIVSLFRDDLINYAVINGSGKLKVIYLRLQELFSVLVSKKIIVQCNNDKQSLIKRTKKYCNSVENKIFIQTNNCDASWINKQRHHKQVYNEIPKILFIGDFSSIRKGHHVLLPAVARLLDEGINCKLYVCGDGKTKSEWEQKYSSYKDIIFCGYCKIDDFLSKCDFMIVPSLIDSCPNTVLESLNANLAVYGANTGGIPELLPDQDFLFNPDIDCIYNFLKEKISNKSYINDATRQKKYKDNLTFDWAKKIFDIVISKSEKVKTIA